MPLRGWHSGRRGAGEGLQRRGCGVTSCLECEFRRGSWLLSAHYTRGEGRLKEARNAQDTGRMPLSRSARCTYICHCVTWPLGHWPSLLAAQARREHTSPLTR